MDELSVQRTLPEERRSRIVSGERQRSQIASIEEEHTKIFASMCPDEILDHYDDYDTRMYHTTLMLGDVSGFTELTEKYTRSGKGGPSKLTETLNSYIGAMVQEILSHNGDVLKFSGDAFIVMWKLESDMVMRDIAIEAMQTACLIQKHFGTYDTDVGITLRVKLAIASGKTYFTSIGNPKMMSYYIITGKPVWDVKFAEALCKGGDILVAPSAWQWANPDDYVHEILPNGIHTLIRTCAGGWYQPKSHHIADDTGDDDDTYGTSKSSISDSIDEAAGGKFFNEVDYSLRPKVIKVAKARLKNSLRSYMLRPVVGSVERDEPLEYLTEMRQVVILFVNVITSSVGKSKLIPLVNSAYNLVCGIVGSMHGCVNKTSLFDKDLMFLCIFGLRGDKHELESQIGLRCATKIRESLVAMSNIKSVSVGVTTGVTYCGVVGHILRREYTVIGMAVNKAARLMVTYINKVVCDRESFLRSQLEARHFVLQEAKLLKGITNVGPVYEFQEKLKAKIPDIASKKYPLLGRESEMQIFRGLLEESFKYQNSMKNAKSRRPSYDTLVIRGEPRMGKTRLLHEMVHNLPRGMRFNYVSLSEAKAKVPHTLIQWIFSTPLGLSDASTSKDRENSILASLGAIRWPQYLCVFNQLFNVHFTVTSKYKALSVINKERVLRKFLLKLVERCFRSAPWLIVIDDAEYSDKESMELLDTIRESDLLFFVLSVGEKRADTENILDSSILDRAQVIELGGIDKWYHAALACQVLNVRGVPVELEKLIQEKSVGNPGWIESYLISLVQAGGILTLSVTKKEAESMGFVLPHISMLERVVSPSVLTESNVEMGKRNDKWQMYKTSCKGSSVSLLLDDKDSPRRKELDLEGNDDEVVTICKIPLGFPMDETDVEISMDVMILKLFDSLTPLDQLLLKSASVLGDVILRELLESLMEDTSLIKIGEAIVKLFDIRVFACAIGHFEDAPNPLAHFENSKSHDFDSEIRCYCTGLRVLEELKHLPEYACCGLIRFKMTMFRETTYRLLTENQKIELHSKALKYLRQTTKRCKACGEGKFRVLLGKKMLHGEYEKRRADIDYLLDIPHFENHREHPSPSKDGGAAQANEADKSSCFDVFRRVERKPTNTFSNIDFTDCRCNLILTTVYTQMLDHCVGIERKDLTLTAILEFVEICLAAYNVPYARKLLTDAQVLLQQMFESSEEQLIVLPYLTSKVQTLLSKCYLDIGLIAEAATTLEDAVKSLGYRFPTTDILVDLKCRLELKRLKLLLTRFGSCQGGINDEHAANYTEQLACCLALMFDVFRAKGMKRQTRLAGVWALNEALALSRNFNLLCTCFTNMLIVAHLSQNRNIIPYVESAGIRMCSNKESLEYQEVKIIAELYAGVFSSRYIRCEIRKAIKLGFVAIRLTHTIGTIHIKLIILPKLIHLLMISCRHSEVPSLLRELEFASAIDMDKSGRTWYYAICADVQLDTGLRVISFRCCEEYYFQEGKSILNLRDSEAQKRYFTSMWLWCIRNREWEASRVWLNRRMLLDSTADRNSAEATITALKKLEGLLITYVHQINTRDSMTMETLKEVQSSFKMIKDMLKFSKIAVPRYMLMKAYYEVIHSHRRTAVQMLRRTKKISKKMENIMIYKWAQHCESAWIGGTSTLQRDMWKENFTRLTSNWKEVNANETRAIFYSLPLPNYNA